MGWKLWLLAGLLRNVDDRSMDRSINNKLNETAASEPCLL
jgi:hypothetical protein